VCHRWGWWGDAEVASCCMLALLAARVSRMSFPLIGTPAGQGPA